MTKTLPCGTYLEIATLKFIRDGWIAGVSNGVLDREGRREYREAIMSADVELCTAMAIGVVVALKVESEKEISERRGRRATAAYTNLLWAARKARAIPAAQ